MFPFIGIMDVFDQILTEQEAGNLLGYEHNLKYGFRYLSSLTRIYRTENEVFVHIYNKGLSKEQFKLILGSLNRIEASIFRKLFAINKGIYKIGDEEHLYSWLKFRLKNCIFLIFSFHLLIQYL
ncbi:hypothetical protein GGGNBK_10835 [Sporosarcina sp. ANT_H38]